MSVHAFLLLILFNFKEKRVSSLLASTVVLNGLNELTALYTLVSFLWIDSKGRGNAVCFDGIVM